MTFPLVCLPFHHSGLLLFACGFSVKEWAVLGRIIPAECLDHSSLKWG